MLTEGEGVRATLLGPRRHAPPRRRGPVRRRLWPGPSAVQRPGPADPGSRPERAGAASPAWTRCPTPTTRSSRAAGPDDRPRDRRPALGQAAGGGPAGACAAHAGEARRGEDRRAEGDPQGRLPRLDRGDPQGAGKAPARRGARPRAGGRHRPHHRKRRLARADLAGRHDDRRLQRRARRPGAGVGRGEGREDPRVQHHLQPDQRHQARPWKAS